MDHRAAEAVDEEDFNPESIYSQDMISQRAAEKSPARANMSQYYDAGSTSQKSTKVKRVGYQPSRIHNTTISQEMRTIDSKGPRTNQALEVVEKAKRNFDKECSFKPQITNY